MAYRKKTWTEKLEDRGKLPKVLRFDPKFPCGNALAKMGARRGDTVVLAPATEVDALMRKVPKGRVTTLKEITMKLAKKHKVGYCCTLVAGIHVMVAANAAEERVETGRDGKVTTPYWRTLKIDGSLNEKYPGGAPAQKKLLEREGHRVVKKGSRYFVDGYEGKLA